MHQIIGRSTIGVLVIGEDITEQLALAAAADAERDHANMLMTMLSNRVLFTRMQKNHSPDRTVAPHRDPRSSGQRS